MGFDEMDLEDAVTHAMPPELDRAYPGVRDRLLAELVLLRSKAAGAGQRRAKLEEVVMPIKIDAPKAWGWIAYGKLRDAAHWDASNDESKAVRVRIMRESDYRKIMAALRAADYTRNVKSYGAWDRMDAALDALGKKGKK